MTPICERSERSESAADIGRLFASSPAGRGVDVQPHPHINRATVTFRFEGEMLHRDSLGSLQAILPGALNLVGRWGRVAPSRHTGIESEQRGLHRLCQFEQ